MKKILLADDNRVFLKLTKSILEENDFKVSIALQKAEVYEQLAAIDYDIFLLDLNFPYSKIGMEVLQYSLENYPELPVVMISGDASIDGAITAIRQGAIDFIEKPVKKDRLLLTINNVLEQSIIKKQMYDVRRKAINMIGSSEKMEKLFQEIMQISQSEFPVLIKGETGSGKDLVAHAIHNLSRRSDNTFIDFNCSAVPKELWESELFGYKKGSFTGAFENKKGYLALADGGSIFMDEISSMPYEMQPKLLRFLENGEIQKIGSEIEKTDVRVLSATNEELEELVRKNQFREDLLFRLNVLEITVPPLREHKEDIPELAKNFLINDCSKEGMEIKEFTNEAIELLIEQNWTGNIRELKNVIDRTLVYSNGDVIKDEDIEKALHGKVISKKKTLREASEQFEREFILNNLTLNDWNVAATAEKIRIERSNLYKKIKHHKIKIRKE